MHPAFENAGRFFIGEANVQRAIRALAVAFEEHGIPYAVCGGMALNAHGYVRVTLDIDVLLTRDSLERLKRELLGRWYTEHARGLRDEVYNISIDVFLAGKFPGDGKPKPIAFPDPAALDVVREGSVAYVPLHRLKDLADVLELIRARQLPADLADQLHPYVRDKFAELWIAAQGRDPE